MSNNGYTRGRASFNYFLPHTLQVQVWGCCNAIRFIEICSRICHNYTPTKIFCSKDVIIHCALDIKTRMHGGFVRVFCSNAVVAPHVVTSLHKDCVPISLLPHQATTHKQPQALGPSVFQGLVRHNKVHAVGKQEQVHRKEQVELSPKL